MQSRLKTQQELLDPCSAVLGGIKVSGSFFSSGPVHLISSFQTISAQCDVHSAATGPLCPASESVSYPRCLLLPVFLLMLCLWLWDTFVLGQSILIVAGCVSQSCCPLSDRSSFLFTYLKGRGTGTESFSFGWFNAWLPAAAESSVRAPVLGGRNEKQSWHWEPSTAACNAGVPKGPDPP